MTNTELKKIISENSQQEWFKNIRVTFTFPLNIQITFIGVSAIYEYVNQQINGWGKYENLPTQLTQCKTYFVNIKNAIDSFITNYSQNDANVLEHYWHSQVVARIGINANQNPLPYNIPQVEFLLKVYNDTPNYFSGAYNFLFKIIDNYSITNPDFLSGAILAYEFTLKDYTTITERRNAEKSSLSKLRNDFQKYLSESEEQLITHLNNANTNYTDYVKKIDDLEKEKDSQITDWFENTKNEEWQKWYDETKQKLANLEETYKEKLKLEEPAKYWSDRANKLRKQGWLFFCITIVFVAVICWSLGRILWETPETIFASWFDSDKTAAIKWTVVYATLISFMAYAIRSLTKFIFSSFHLARDCEERHTLTYFYLSLLKDSNVADSDRQLIMQSLFSRADTGLLKDDSSPKMPSNEILKNIFGQKT